MTYRTRSILVILIFLVAVVALFYATTYLVIRSGMEQMDQQNAQALAQEVWQALQTELQDLDRVAVEYARSDETYQYVQDHNAAYAKSLFDPKVFQTLRLNGILIYDQSRVLVQAASFDLSQGGVISVTTNLQNRVNGTPPIQGFPELRTHPDIDSHIRGLALLPDGPIMIVSRPILKSDGSGPVIGSLILSRNVDQAEASRLSAMVHTSVRVLQRNTTNPPPEEAALWSLLTPERPTLVRVLDAQQFETYALVLDLANQPILILRAEAPRQASQQGLQSLGTLLGVVAGVGVLMIILAALVFLPVLMRPLARLNRQISAIRNQVETGLRIPVVGKDELSNLTRTANDMLATIEQRNRELELHKALQKRQAQLATAVEIGREINASMSLNEILHKTVNLLGEKFGFYYVGIFSVDEKGLFAVLQAGTGDVIPVGYAVTIGGVSTIGQAIASRKPQIAKADDKGNIQAFAQLPMARSEIALPLSRGGEMVGAMVVQSTLPGAFDKDEDIAGLMSVAESLGLAIANARWLASTQARIQELEARQRRYLVERWSDELKLQGTLEYTFTSDELASPDEPVYPQTFPLVLDDVPIGRLVLENHKAEWTPEEKAFVEAVLAQTAQALEQARMLNASQRYAAQERLVSEITRTIRSSTNVESILSTAILELGRSLKASYAQIHLQNVDEHSSAEEEADGSGQAASSARS